MRVKNISLLCTLHGPALFFQYVAMAIRNFVYKKAVLAAITDQMVRLG